MKFDYVIYARGAKAKDDYALRLAPEYIPPQLSGFLASCLDSVRSIAGTLQGSPAEVSDQLRRSFLYLELPEQGFCLVLRVCSPIRDRASGAVWTDASDRALWDAEGLCCRWADRDRFRLLLPSVLLALSRQEETLLQKHFPDILEAEAEADHAPQTELESRRFVNPLNTDGTYPESAFADTDLPQTRLAVQQLLERIYRTGNIPQFTFGPAAAEVRRLLPQRFGISFPLPEDTAPVPDQLGVYQTVSIVKPAKRMLRRAVLQCCFQAEGSDDMLFQWALSEDLPSHEGDILIASPAYKLQQRNGISLLKLTANAEYIRDFAQRLQWEPRANGGDAHSYYRFTKEE